MLRTEDVKNYAVPPLVRRRLAAAASAGREGCSDSIARVVSAGFCFKPISWDKRPAERRRRLILRFLKTPARSRAHPSDPTAASGRPLRDVVRRVLRPPCTNRRLSAREARGYFFPSLRFFYPIRQIGFCQACLCLSISPALCRVVSVMFAPPMMRASSCRRPSKSSGVTSV